MITYCYSTKDGRVHEWDTRMGMAPQCLLVGGCMAERDLVAEHSGQESGDAWTEHESAALMVHPSQIPEAVADAKRKGLNVEFNPHNGCQIFHGASERKRYLKAYGYADLNSFC
jgi:hypothetical protein